jgi:NAD+ kinase
MATVALIVHEMRDDAETQARALAHWLAERGHKLAILANNTDELDGGAADLEAMVREPDELAADAALVVSLGGDGSMLRAVDLAAPYGVPVLGVNFGQLGYLTEVEPAGMLDAVDAALSRTAAIEERMRVQVSVIRTDGSEFDAGHALNEALVERGESGRTVRLGLSIDDEFFLSYNADGIIVASPTGSTAYSMSARGPIVAPGHQALIVTAVSPHQLFDRSLVLKPDSTVEVEVLPNRNASLSLDGRDAVALQPGDRVVCRRSDTPGRIVSLRNADFLTVLKTKFGLEDR